MNAHTRLPDTTQSALRECANSFPVKLGQLAEKLGIQVYRATLPAGISGEIKLNEAGSYIIRVNRHEAPERQRFTLAHEIGHYLLHKDMIGDGVSDDALYRSKLSNAMEYEANKFAANLLMPRDEIEIILSRSWASQAEMVDFTCNRFGVSPQAAQVRLGL